jgi:hypothetical protein
MTDEELIKRLRAYWGVWDATRAGGKSLTDEAADRIEALVRGQDATWNAAISAAAKMADEGMDSHRAIAADIRTLLEPEAKS